MISEISPQSMETRSLVISNLPETATEDLIKQCFERHGHIQSIEMNEQHCALVIFGDIHTALKAHHAENIVDKQQLRTEFSDGWNCLSKESLETSPVASSIVERSSSSSSSITNETIMDKTIPPIDQDRDKRPSRPLYSPEENTRHQVVPMKDETANSTMEKRQTSSGTNSKNLKMKSTRRKHDSSSSERSHSSSKHSHPKKRKHSETRILKISPLPSKISTQSLRETLRNLFLDFKKSSHLLNIKIVDDYALLTFRKSDDVDRAQLFIKTKSLHGMRLKGEPYDGSIFGNEEHDLIQRTMCSDLDLDEYSAKATRTLYIGNLPSDISYQELRETYSVYGEIIEIEIKRPQPPHSQIFAFVQYTDIKSVVKALKSKVIHYHLTKLGFGKSQPTNVLWLDELPLNTSESVIRSFVTRVTNLLSNEILDIYVDNENHQKMQIAQCLIYFADTVAAQTAISSIRGKKLDSKRIQIDFASRVFLTKFSDIIQEANQKKNNDRWPTNPPYRRYSKTSDGNSSVVHDSPHHRRSSSFSSSESSINHKKSNIKPEGDKHANTERIFDWLMQNSHPTIKNTDEDIAVKPSNSSKPILPTAKKVFQTKIIPLDADPLFPHTDIRLKLDPSLNNQCLRSLSFPFPNFAKHLLKPLQRSIILNPKAYLKHTLNEEIPVDKELDERIKLLDQKIQISTSVLSLAMPMTKSTPINSSFIFKDKPNGTVSDDISIKSKQKAIPPPLSVISTIPKLANINPSPILSASKSLTPTSATTKQYQSPGTTFSPVFKQQTVANSPKPLVLKSILKTSSNSSPSTPNETRKAVQIISTKSPSESTFKERILPEMKKLSPSVETNKPKSTLTVTKKVPVMTKIPLKNPGQLKPPVKLAVLPKKSPSILIKNPLPKKVTAPPKPVSNSSKIPTKKSLKLRQTCCMYDRIKQRTRNDQIRPSPLPNKDHPKKTLKNKSPMVFDSEIFDTEENETKKTKPLDLKKWKFHKRRFLLKNKLKPHKKRRSSIDETNQCSKKVKIEEQELIQPEKSPVKIEQQQEEIIPEKKEIIQTVDPNPSKDIKSHSVPEENVDEKPIPMEIPLEEPIVQPPPPTEEPQEALVIIPDQSEPVDTNPSITKCSSDTIELSHISSSEINETANQIEGRSTSYQKPSSTSLHLFPQILTPDSDVFTPPYQHFSYPLFVPPISTSPPLSARTRSISNASSTMGNCFYNAMLPGQQQQQHWYEKDSRRESLSKYSTSSSSPCIESDSTSSQRNSFEFHNYPSNPPPLFNSFPSDFYRMNEFPVNDPYDIQWEGYIVLKTDQAFIKTQLIAGNSQIARISINYWNSDLDRHLRISQRMRLEEIQLDGVKKHMQMENDYCLLIGEANGVTLDQLQCEQNHLKNGVIQYLKEKKAAGILNILLPGVFQPVYVVHIFPPCSFASEILQKRAPDAYRCVVQNKTEQIYLLFIITSTIQ